MKRYILLLLFFLLCVGNLIAFTTEKELFSLAESRYYAKNYPVALETYDEFVKTYPLSDLIPDGRMPLQTRAIPGIPVTLKKD
jgi:hypothetical protein